MSNDSPRAYRPLTVDGVPMHERLACLESQLVKQITVHLDQEVPDFHLLSPDRVEDGVRRLIQLNLGHSARILRDRRTPLPGELVGVGETVARTVRAGIPFATVLRALQIGLRSSWSLLVRDALPSDMADVLLATELFLQYQEAATVAACTEIGEFGPGDVNERTARRRLLTAMLEGDSYAALSDRAWTPIAGHYHVLRFAFDSSDIPAEPVTLNKLESALEAFIGEPPLVALSPTRGIALLPIGNGPESCGRDELERLVARLAAVSGFEMVAAVAASPVEGIPAASEETQKVLDTLLALRRPAGLYELADIPLEVQVATPGPAGDALAARLAPLEGIRYLLDTLETYLRHDANRRKTATEKGVHANTIDYRLKRIAELTGLDPARPADLQLLSAAHMAQQIRDARDKRSRPDF